MSEQDPVQLPSFVQQLLGNEPFTMPGGQSQYTIPTPQPNSNPVEIEIDAPKFGTSDEPPNAPPRIATAAPAGDDDEPQTQQTFGSSPSQDIREVWAEVARLRNLVQGLMRTTRDRTGPPIFLARVQSGSAWNEVATESGNISDNLSGRTSNGADTFAAKVPPLGTQTIFQMFDGSATNYFQAADRAVVVKITGNASGGGKYNGRTIVGTTTAAASGTLALPEGMTVPSADDALILNPAENANSTHTLNSGMYFAGVLLGQTTGATPKNIIMLAGQAGSSASGAANVPTTFGTVTLPLTFGTTSVPLTFTTASVPLTWSASGSCDGSGNFTITLTPATSATVLTGIASTASAYTSIATTATAYNSTTGFSCVATVPGACA